MRSPGARSSVALLLRALPWWAFAWWALPWWACLSVACGGGGNARLEIEIAPTPSASAPEGDAACSATSETLSRVVECIGVSVCERQPDGDCDRVPVLRPEDDHGGMGLTELRFSRVDAPSISFDVRLEQGSSYEVEIVAYDGDGNPVSRGRAEGVTAGASTIRVRLEPFRTWACAGPADGGGAPLSRALHQAVTLDTGDVLLVGGVTGDAVSATAVEAGAALQRTIEVYEIGDARFHTVTATDTDGVPGFGAVFHRAVYLGRMADGRHRVRSIGGFAANGVDPAARFDAIQGLNYFNAPLLPGARTDVRDSVDILYDAGARSAEIVSVEPGPVPRAGFDAVSEPDADDLVAVVLGLEDGGGTALRPRPMLSGRWYALPVSGFGSAMSMPLLAPRFGATASRLSAAQVLVWGGNVDELTPEDVAARAGEILGTTSAPVAAGVGMLPPSTALHTATPIAGGVLIAGGLVVAPVMGMSGGMTTAASPQPLTVVSLDMAGLPQGTPVAVDSTWETPILHAAVTLADDSVVITGGAVREIEGMASHLWPRGQAIRVSRDATGVYVTERLPGMIVPRWGHAMSVLPHGRVLVTGGFVREGPTLRAIAAPEVIVLEAPPASITSCGVVEASDGGARDGGARVDAASPDAGAPAEDAQVGDDAGIVPMDDAGL